MSFKSGAEWNGNKNGRPKGTGGLKDYDRKKFTEMDDEQKDEFLNKLAPDLRYRMAEGNPHNTTDLNPDNPMLVEIKFDESFKKRVKPEGKSEV